MATKWSALFEAWQRAVIETDEEPRLEALFRAPSEPGAIDALEARLGTRLPPSYRAFLEHTDGALAFPGWGVVRWGLEREPADGLMRAAQVAWLRDYDRLMAGWVEEPERDDDHPPWRHPAFDAAGPERDYLYPDGGGDPVFVKAGHLVHGLAISVIVDGYHTVLNPLVVDADGEWEAWDAGTKLPGAIRHASFAALLEADIARARAERERRTAAAAGVEASVARVLDVSAPVDDRLAAAWKAFEGGARSQLVPGLASIATDRSLDLTPRQTALRLLGYVGGREALDVLARAAAEPEPRIRAMVLPPLAVSDDPADREIAIDILADPATPAFVARSTYRPAGSVVWEAYRRSRNEGLLPWLAYLGEPRAAEDIVAILRDPARTPDSLRDLLTYSYYLRDPRIASALAECARRVPVWRSNVGANLADSGALDEAISLLAEAMLDGDGFGMPEQTLARVRDPRAGAALLEGLRRRPSGTIARALGWFPEPDAVEALVAAIDAPGVHLGAIDALETMGTPEARDALAARSGAGDHLASRALARLRDTRAREPLLAWLGDADADLARVGADGLRDLRDPSTAPALVRAASHADPDVAVIAVHALVTMGSPRLPEGLVVLGRHADPRARALAARWTARLDAAG